VCLNRKVYSGMKAVSVIPCSGWSRYHSVCCVGNAEDASCGRHHPTDCDESIAAIACATTAVCAGCRRPIRDQYMLRVEPGLDWHASCLRCAECRRTLDESCTCFVRDGRAYCKLDYGRSAFASVV